MARKSKIEELSVIADPWNLKLKPAKLKGVPCLSSLYPEFEYRQLHILSLPLGTP
jgi:hypothetical protein